jgi:hypothetical protein
MSTETYIDQTLSAAPAVAALVGARIFGGHAPPQTAAPYLVWAIITSDEENAHDDGPDTDTLVSTLVSVSAYATTYAQAGALSAAAMAALRAGAMPLTVDVPKRDTRDDSLSLYRRDFDCTLWE